MKQRSKMRSRSRMSAQFDPPARRETGSTPGVTTSELERALEGLYRAPSLNGLDLIE